MDVIFSIIVHLFVGYLCLLALSFLVPYAIYAYFVLVIHISILVFKIVVGLWTAWQKSTLHTKANIVLLALSTLFVWSHGWIGQLDHAIQSDSDIAVSIALAIFGVYFVPIFLLSCAVDGLKAWAGRRHTALDENMNNYKAVIRKQIEALCKGG